MTENKSEQLENVRNKIKALEDRREALELQIGDIQLNITDAGTDAARKISALQREVSEGKKSALATQEAFYLRASAFRDRVQQLTVKLVQVEREHSEATEAANAAWKELEILAKSPSFDEILENE